MTYFNQGQQRLAFDIELHNEAAVYYGVGVDAGSHDANKQEFDEQLVSLIPSYMTQVAQTFRAKYGLFVPLKRQVTPLCLKRTLMMGTFDRDDIAVPIGHLSGGNHSIMGVPLKVGVSGFIGFVMQR
ncbi:hypothetical protein H5300_20465 [Vibrio sp. SG41-7]|uniref:hypothetical protein n=1 Tax=Vibrio sp. SG41-7 TaxID=2760973 RepID=UPI00160032E8|nr:hypothetical protein [Vibrio sp. SG41-7]MBB1465647.1 hypothetical protein [Vibrio sp. SG41-7]